MNFVYFIIESSCNESYFSLSSWIRWNVTEVISATRTNAIRSTLKVSECCITPCASKEKVGAHFNLLEKGRNLVSEGKIAMVLVVNDSERQGSDPFSVDSESNENKTSSLVQTILCDDQRLVKVMSYFDFHLWILCNISWSNTLRLAFLT